MLKPIFFICSLCLAGAQVTAQLVFNELMVRNQTSLTDVFGETDDWLELYNGTGSIVNLSGYYFTDNPDNLTKFQIPTDGDPLFILPNNHLILWVDKDPEQGVDHLDLGISSEGEQFIMVEPDGVTIVDDVTFPVGAPDVSYGRETDGSAEWRYFSVPTPDDENAYIPTEPATLFINEVMPDNESYFDDPFDEFDAWFEIYNPNAFAVNMAEYAVYLDGALLHSFENIDPLNTVIEDGEFALFWCDAQTEQGGNHLYVNLPVGGATIALEHVPTGDMITEYTYPALAANVAWGRAVDGGNTSQEFDQATPRVTNTLVFVEPEELYINELMADNATDITDEEGKWEDWVEIYNPNDYPVNLAGYFISDNPENTDKFEIAIDNPDSTTIAAGGWMLFWADEDGNQGVRHMNFKFNAGGEEVSLYSPDAFSVADRISYVDMPEDTSYGRIFDGNIEWVLFSGTTPDASNGQGIVASVQKLNNAAQTWSIGPNPSADGQLFWQEPRDVKVYNSAGALLKIELNVQQLSLAGFPAGMYLLHSSQGEQVRVVLNR